MGNRCSVDNQSVDRDLLSTMRDLIAQVSNVLFGEHRGLGAEVPGHLVGDDSTFEGGMSQSNRTLCVVPPRTSRSATAKSLDTHRTPKANIPRLCPRCVPSS